MGRAWTAEEERRLCDLVMEGVSRDYIGQELNRTYTAISNKIYQLQQHGWIIVPPKRRYTATEDELIRKWAPYKNWEAIARHLGRTRGSVFARAKTLGLICSKRAEDERDCKGGQAEDTAS